MSSNNKRSHSSGSSSPQPRKRQLIDGEQQDMDIDGEESKLENEENLENSKQEDGSVSRRAPSLEEERLDLEQAKIMLKRLDFKSAIEICNKAIELDYTTKVSFLLLRSSARARNGDFELAEQDAKAAVDLEKGISIQAHLTSGFAYLRRAKHHFSLAESLFDYDEDELPDSGPFQESDFEGFQTQLSSMGSKEFQSSVQTFPQEVLTRMFYHLDAPSLVKVGSVQKEWSRIILATSSLFHNFEMVGKGDPILKGLRMFQTRSNNKVRGVEIRIQERMSEELKEALVIVISRSSEHLESLSIAHHGDMDASMIEIAERCSSLKVFSSSRIVSGNKLSRPLRRNLVFKSNSTQLEVFNWFGRAYGLQCDKNLLRHFSSRCRSVSIASFDVTSEFLVGLLSSQDNKLETVEIPYFQGSDIDEIPVMRCHQLDYLKLMAVPKQFLERLISPKLDTLYIAKVLPQSLSSMPKESIPNILCIDQILSDSHTTSSGVYKVSALVKSIQAWNLQVLELERKLPQEFGPGLDSNAWNHFLYLLSPLSRENIEAGLNLSVPLSNLYRLNIGQVTTTSTSAAIKGKALASLFLSRFRTSIGSSALSIMSASNGDFNSEVSSGEPCHLCCVKLGVLKVHMPISCDEFTKDWLKSRFITGKHQFVNSNELRLPKSEIKLRRSTFISTRVHVIRFTSMAALFSFEIQS